MNAIPLVRNDFRIDKSMNRVTPGEPIGSKASAMGGAVGGSVSENQLRQEVNTSIVALKREAFSLETLLAQVAQELISLNNRISALEGDYVKKSDVTDTVESGNSNPVSSQGVKTAIDALDASSVGGSGKYISAISETDGVISATASNLSTTPTSGSSDPITSGAVYNSLLNKTNISYSNLNTKVSNVRFVKIVRLGKLVFCTWSFDLSSTLNENELFCTLDVIAEETMFFSVDSPYSNKFTSFRIEANDNRLLNGGALSTGIVYSFGTCFIAKDI